MVGEGRRRWEDTKVVYGRGERQKFMSEWDNVKYEVLKMAERKYRTIKTEEEEEEEEEM